MNDPQFARLFDAQYRGFQADLPFWRRLAGAYGGPILELGCGPGRVLLDLAAAGYHITGVDNDPVMLQRARTKIPQELADRIRLVASDLRWLALCGPYRLALAPCNTLSYLADAALDACLASIARCLAPGGALAADLPSPSFEHLNSAPPQQELFHEPERGTDIQVTPRIQPHPEQGYVDVTWRYDEMLPDGGVERVQLPLRYHLRTRQEVEARWRRAGFNSFKMHGDYSGAPLSPRAEGMLVVAQRAN